MLSLLTSTQKADIRLERGTKFYYLQELPYFKSHINGIEIEITEKKFEELLETIEPENKPK